MHRFAFPSVAQSVMILSCPECGTQYTLKEAQLGPRGRTVRCAACKHTWHAEIPVDLRYSEPKKFKELEPEQDLQSVQAKKLPGKYRAMLEDKKRMRALAVEAGMWGGMAALILAVLALGYFLRVDVVKAFPRVAGAYAMVGLDVKGTNLRFVSQTAEPVLKGGRFVVTVKAQVTNIGDQPEPVPPVRAKMQDAALQPFGSVLMPSGDLVVAPHATRTLTFDIADPTNKVAHLDLDFDLEAMKKGHKSESKGDHKPAAPEHGEPEHGAPEQGAPEPAAEHGHAAADAHDMAAGSEEAEAQEANHDTARQPATSHEEHAEAIIDMPQDPSFGSQTIDTGAPTKALSRKPAHALRGALSFNDDKTAKAGRRESKS